MDGLLIDSEPLWQQAEIEIFKTVGLDMTPEQSAQSMGLRLDKVVEFWYTRHPWKTASQKDIEQAILERMLELVAEKGEAKEGVYEILDFFAAHDLPMAIASSSHMILIKAVVNKLGIKEYFKFLYSAEFEPYGKPHPGVYLNAALKLNVPPENCLVLEDSIRGIISAKAAEMTCIAVPDPIIKDDPRLSLADRVLQSLADFDEPFWNLLNAVE
jgi:sugar-phosphatase